MANQTMQRFGHPETLIRDYSHWVVLLRDQQVTLGSLVLAAKSEATAFSELTPDAFVELSSVVGDIERALRAAVNYQKINYLMLMMVDPNVRVRHQRVRSGVARRAAAQGCANPHGV